MTRSLATLFVFLLAIPAPLLAREERSDRADSEPARESAQGLRAASGSASDSGGSNNTLTNNNTITYSAGKLANAANLVAASSQSFTIANGSWTNLDPSTSLSLSFWVKLSSLPGSNQYTIVSKDNGTSGDFRVLREMGISPIFPSNM